MNSIIQEEQYTVRPLKDEGKYKIDKVTEKDGKVYYDVYDKDDNLQNSFYSLKEAREWARFMSK